MKRPLTWPCLSLILVAACTFTTTRIKDPQFTASAEMLSQRIGQLVSCQHIQVDGKVATTNGKTSSKLEIDIINGKNIPIDTAQMKALGKSIAATVKSELQDINSYDSYEVLFVKVDSTGMTTKRQWTGWIYKSAELPNKKFKDPVFAGSMDSLFQKLGRLLACEKFKTVGWVVTRNDAPSSEMYIEVVNSKNIPTEDRRLRALSKIVAGDFKRALADTTEYGVYRIYFVAEQGDSSLEKPRIVTFYSYEL